MADALVDDYLREVRDVYARAAEQPDPGLCCVPGTGFSLPDLVVPPVMHEMNYGCGSTVNPADLAGERPILYVGVGGGLEALQFAYFRRRPGAVIAVDPVAEMREAAANNLRLAARENPWFRPEFVTLLGGSADALPVRDECVGAVAQNCLFNVFANGDLERALHEVRRVLAPGGRFVCSDPIAAEPIPDQLRRDTTLRARCLSGCRTYEEYLDALQGAGFGQVTVRSRRPYRVLTPHEFPVLARPLLLESLDVLAVKTDARARFTGRCAVFTGKGSHALRRGASFPAGTPLPVSDEVAEELSRRPDFVVTKPTYHAPSAGCC